MLNMVVSIDGQLVSRNEAFFGQGLLKESYLSAKEEAIKYNRSEKWLLGVCWDCSKADKPTALSTPHKVDLDGDDAYDKIKGWNIFGNYYMVFDNEDEAKKGFIDLCDWLFDKRLKHLQQKHDDFLLKREDFMKRQAKKVK